MKPSILHIITAFDRGGAENHLVELVRHQLALGFRVTVAYSGGRGGWASTVREWGGAVHDLDLRFYGDPRAWRNLRALISSERFSIIHAHLPPAELYTRLALLGLRQTPPLIISKHNDCPFHRLPGEKLIERWVACRASAIIAISSAVHRYMADRQIAPERLVTISYGIDIVPYDAVSEKEVGALRREWGLTAGTMAIGFVGRLVAQKSIETLIRAYALLRRETKVETRLVIVGEGPLGDDLRHCAEQEGVGESVVWAGFREEIPAVMRAIDVFALTSDYEGFGLVLVEAMAARRPVVATRVSAIPEIVVDGETGLLAEPRSAESVANALMRLTEPALRDQLGAAGRRRVVEHFTLEQMWQSTDAVYARCAAKEGGALFQSDASPDAAHAAAAA